MPRAKFFRHYGPCQLRVEQIGPDLWHGAVYERWPLPNWERFTCLNEACAKQCAVVTAKNRLERRRLDETEMIESQWFDDSDRADAEWTKEIAALGFPGYVDRDGMEMFASLREG